MELTRRGAPIWGRALCRGDASRVGSQAGFTLVEAMIAGALSLALALPAYALLRNTYGTALIMNSRFQRNAEARQLLTLLGEGSSGSYGGTFVHGIRGLSAIPSSWVLNQGGQFIMSDPGTGASISGDSIPTITIACTGAQTPMPACTAAGATITTKGWLGANPVVTTTTGSRTVAVGITIADPYQAGRAGQMQTTTTDTYRSQFNLNLQ